MRLTKRSTAAITVTALLASLGLTACGSSKTSDTGTSATRSAAQSTQAETATTPAPAPPSSSASRRKIVARVGRKPITLGTVEHLMALAYLAAPPSDRHPYTNCSTKTAKATGPKKELEGRHACEHEYGELLRHALTTAIHNDWLIGEAAEDGLSVSDREVQQELTTGKKIFKTDAKFEAYRKSTGQTFADITREIQVSRLTNKIYKRIKEKEHVVTGADVARYYRSHRQQFAIPEGRTVRIVRTATEGAAIKIKKELESGTSFAAAAKELSTIGQPLEAKNGEVVDLVPGVYEEPRLNNAIFSARLNRLYGPIQLTAYHKTIAPETNTGFFIFEVKRIVPGKAVPLARVKSTIAEELKSAEKERSLVGFTSAYRRKWMARTDCQPGYVVKNCRQFKLSKGEEALEAHNL